MRNPVLTSQPASIKWLLLLGLSIALSSCSEETEEIPSQLLSATTEDKTLNRWILNYLAEEASAIKSSPISIGKFQHQQVPPTATEQTPAISDSLGYLSWIEESDDSTRIFAQVVYALPDSLLQPLGDILSNAELVIDLSVANASDSTSIWLPPGDATKALQQAALGSISDRSSTTPFLVTLPGTLSQQGSPMDRKVDVERLVIPLKLVH